MYNHLNRKYKTYNVQKSVTIWNRYNKVMIHRLYNLPLEISKI